MCDSLILSLFEPQRLVDAQWIEIYSTGLYNLVGFGIVCIPPDCMVLSVVVVGSSVDVHKVRLLAGDVFENMKQSQPSVLRGDGDHVLAILASTIDVAGTEERPPTARWGLALTQLLHVLRQSVESHACRLALCLLCMDQTAVP